MEKQTTPTERLLEVANTFKTDEERKAFIEGANYILDQFEHWATGLWLTHGGPDHSNQFVYGYLVAHDIKDKKIPMFRTTEYK